MKSIVPDVTFIATANAVTLTGATPVLVDVDPETLNIDPGAVGGRDHAADPAPSSPCTSAAGRPRSIALLEVADAPRDRRRRGCRRGAAVRGTGGRCLGTFGRAGCFSFSPNKTITTGQGGLIVTDDDALVVRLRELKDQGRPVRGTGGNDVHAEHRLQLQADEPAGSGRRRPAGEARDPRRALAAIYRGTAAAWPASRQVRVLPFDVERGESPQWVDALVDHRDGLVDHLKRFDIALPAVLVSDPHAAPVPARRRRVSRTPCADARRAFWLPSALSLSDDDVRTVCGRIRDFYRRRARDHRRGAAGRRASSCRSGTRA